LGVVLNIIQAFIRRDLKEALFGQWGLSGLVAYWIAVTILVTNSKFSWDKVIIIFVFLLPIMLKVPISNFLSNKKAKPHHKEEHEEEHGEGIIESAFQIYEVVLAYLANTLSFIRVAAFDLSHASLMTALYLLTKIMGGDNSLFISLPSNVMSNIFVIVLEGLIVFIQCMRLEYYEFFAKFFAGGGLEYKPLKMN
jgi:V/A-type H+/Na+-transporting ATPase subunit I